MKPKPKILPKTSNLLVRITKHSKKPKKNATFTCDKNPNYLTWCWPFKQRPKRDQLSLKC